MKKSMTSLQKIMDFLNRNLTEEIVDLLKENHPHPRGGWTVKKSSISLRKIVDFPRGGSRVEKSLISLRKIIDFLEEAGQ